MKKILIILLILIFKPITTFTIEILWENKIHEAQINKLIFNQSENIIISCGYDKKIKFCSAANGEKLKEFSFANNIYDISLMKNENYLLVSSKHMTGSSIFIFNIGIDSVEKTFNLKLLLDSSDDIHNQELIEVHAVQIDDVYILTGIGIYKYQGDNHYYTGRLDLWDIETKSLIKEVFKGGMVNNLVISDDKKNIAFSTVENTSEYYSPGVYREIQETKLFVTDTSFSKIELLREDYDENFVFPDTEVINDIAFSNSSGTIAVATDEHHLFVYDIENKSMMDSIYSCECYTDQVIDFINDDKHVITGTNNGKINIWNLEYNLKRDSYTYLGNQMITSIATTRKNNFYAVADVEGNISLMSYWELNTIDDKTSNKKPNYIVKNSRNYLELVFLNYNKLKEITVFNLIGQKIENVKIKNNDKSIIVDYDNLTNGIYILVGNIGEEIIFEKFQKID